MPVRTQISSLDSVIGDIVSRTAAEIASAVRANIADEVQRLVGGRRLPGDGVPVRRGPGRPPKAAVALGGSAGKTRRARPAKFVRRSPQEIAADNDKLLAYIKANPGQRSEEIQKGLGLAKPNVASGLQVLRDDGKIKMKGIKRAATYSAA